MPELGARISPSHRPLIADGDLERCLAAARAGDQAAFGLLTEPHRRELQVYCYRMLGSLQDAEDMVQETFFRAWRRLDTFAGRSSLRAWLYKIATNACLDMLRRRPRRTLPPALYEAADPDVPLAPPLVEPVWLEPFPDELLDREAGDPEARFASHETITLAFLAALQALPPRQRAVLILRDVLDWHAAEVADLLELSVSAVNSALHRARATLAAHYHRSDAEPILDAADNVRTHALLERYVRAWENADIDAIIALLKEDAVYPMPPSPSWYRGRAAIRAFIAGNILAEGAAGIWRLVPTRANGQPAVAWYRHDPVAAVFRPFAIQVLVIEGDLLEAVITFAIPPLFACFGLPHEISSSV